MFPSEPEYLVVGSHARFSPDGEWMAFEQRQTGEESEVFLAPFNDKVDEDGIPSTKWFKITGQDDHARGAANFSPDGNILYVFAARDGYWRLWGRRLDPRSRRPIGALFPVRHFHGHLRASPSSLHDPSYSRDPGFEISAGGGRLFMTLTEYETVISLGERIK